MPAHTRARDVLPYAPPAVAVSPRFPPDFSIANKVVQPSEPSCGLYPAIPAPRTSASVKSAPGEDPPTRRLSGGVQAAPDAEDDPPAFDDTDDQKAPQLKKQASGVTAFLEARQKLRTTEAQKLIAFTLVCFTVGLDFAGFTLTAPLVPFYVEEFEDGKEMGFGTANSILTASYAVSMFVATPLFGTMSDRFGRRTMLLASLLGGGLGFIGQGFAPSMKALIGIRFVTGCFGGSRPVAVAWIGDMYPPEQQARKIAMIATAISVSLFIAPVCGGSMGLISLSLPCFFQAAVTLILFGLAWIYVMEPEKAKPAGASGGAPVEKPKIPTRPLAINALNGALSMGIVAGWQTLFPVVGSADLELDQNTIGLMQGLGGLAVGFTQFAVFVPLGKRFKLPFIGGVGMIMSASPFVIGLIENLWVAVACFPVHAAGAALALPGVSVTASILSPPAHRGKILSLTYTAQAASRVIFPILVGPMYDAAKIIPFLMILVVGILGFISHMLLAPFIGKLGAKPPGPPAGPKSEADQDATGTEEEKRRSLGKMLQGLQSVKDELELELKEWRDRLAGLEGGSAPAELGVPTDLDALPEVEDGHQVELGRWLSTLLVARNYRDWPANLSLVETTLKNAFPRINAAPKRRVEDLVYLLESHLQLEKLWERYSLRGMVGGDEMGEVLAAKGQA